MSKNKLVKKVIEIKNIYKEGELEDKATIRDFRIVQIDEYSRSKLIEVDLTVSRIVPKWSQCNFAGFSAANNKGFLSSIK